MDVIRFVCTAAVNGGNARRQYREGFVLGGFTSFTEYFGARQPLAREEIEFVKSVLKGGGHLFDVGANLGFVTCLMARQASTALVHAFEANPSTFSALESNIKLNRLQNVLATCAAVADRDGEILFHASAADRFTASIARASDELVIRVPAVSVDQYCASRSIRQIDFLKIDVEGYEAVVLRGATDLLSRRAVGAIFFEVGIEQGRLSGHSAADAIDVLSAFGYKIYRLVRGSLTAATAEDIPAVGYTNFIALN